MDEIRVNMVKFLMTMFETSSDNANSVRMFKANVEELVRRNQIPNSVKNLIYNMYGITNTDTFKPNAQNNKLMQINMLMMQLDNIIKSGTARQIEIFKQNIENGVRMGSILKSARDIVFDIYSLDSHIKTNIQNNKVVPDLGPVIDVVAQGKVQNNTKSSNMGKSKAIKAKEVQIDIAQFKSQYVSEIYYEYPNPNYDGCSGSSMEKRVKLIDAMERPQNAKFVIHKMISDDGCHQTWRYVPVPKEYYKPTTTVKTPTTGSAVGCTGGGYSMRTC